MMNLNSVNNTFRLPTTAGRVIFEKMCNICTRGALFESCQKLDEMTLGWPYNSSRDTLSSPCNRSIFYNTLPGRPPSSFSGRVNHTTDKVVRTRAYIREIQRQLCTYVDLRFTCHYFIRQLVTNTSSPSHYTFGRKYFATSKLANKHGRRNDPRSTVL